MIVALVLAAIDFHLAGRHRLAFWTVVLRLAGTARGVAVLRTCRHLAVGQAARLPALALRLAGAAAVLLVRDPGPDLEEHLHRGEHRAKFPKGDPRQQDHGHDQPLPPGAGHDGVDTGAADRGRGGDPAQPHDPRADGGRRAVGGRRDRAGNQGIPVGAALHVRGRRGRIGPRRRRGRLADPGAPGIADRPPRRLGGARLATQLGAWGTGLAVVAIAGSMFGAATTSTVSSAPTLPTSVRAPRRSAACRSSSRSSAPRASLPAASPTSRSGTRVSSPGTPTSRSAPCTSARPTCASIRTRSSPSTR